jgi:hypothetical protein
MVLCYSEGERPKEDSICLPETNVNWNLPDQCQLFHNALQKTWLNSSSSISRSPEDFLLQFQPGGTATIICDNWISRILEKGEDHKALGRWFCVTLREEGQRKIVFITAYNASYNTGDTTN